MRVQRKGRDGLRPRPLPTPSTRLRHAIDATASVTHRTTRNGRPCLGSSRTSRPGTARRDCSRACARRAAPLLVGTALFACGAPLVLVDALALPKPELLRLALESLAALTHDAQERTASDDVEKSRIALDALLAGYPPPERNEVYGSGISTTFLTAFARALAKVLAKYHKADAHVHASTARCLAILARERRNAPRVLRALGASSSSSGGSSLLTRAVTGLTTSLTLREGARSARGVRNCPPRHRRDDRRRPFCIPTGRHDRGVQGQNFQRAARGV